MKDGWRSVPIEQVCTIQPSKAEVRERLGEDKTVSFVPMESLGIGTKEVGVSGTRRLGDVIGSYTYFADGDVLLAKITPCFENGKLGIARNLTNGVGFGSSEYIVFRPSPSLRADFLYYFLSQQSFRDAAARRMTGTAGQKRVTRSHVSNTTIPLPPRKEQERIVAILDEAFEGIASAKSNLEKCIHNADDLIASWRHARLNAERAGWRTVTLPDISTNLDGRRVPVTKSDRKAGNYPYYGASGIVDYVSDYLFEGDSLLVSEDGANLLARSTPIAFPATGKYWVNNHAHILQFPHRATQDFAELYLESISLKEYVTGAAQPKLTQKALNSIPIHIPSTVEEQSDVVEKFRELSSRCRLLDENLHEKLRTLEQLKQSLLHQAFSGNL